MIDIIVSLFILWILPNKEPERRDPDEMMPYIGDHFANKDGGGSHGGEN